MDMRTLSTQDLQAIEAGDMSRVSDAGLQLLAQGEAKPAPDSAASRFATGAMDPIHGGAQLLTHALPEGVVNAGNRFNNWLADKTGIVAKLPEGGVDQAIKEREAAYSAPEGFDWARTAGRAFSPANLALASTVPAAGPLVLRTAMSAGAGAAAGALEPAMDFARDKPGQVTAGAIGGAAAPFVAGTLSRIISPKASTNPDLKALKAAGVKPTIGQSLGGRWNATEEKLMSVPVVGDAIAHARGRAQQQFNQAAIGRTIEPLNQLRSASGQASANVPEIGQRGVAEAGDILGSAYDDVLASLKVVHFDRQFATDVAQLKRLAKGLTPSMAMKFNRELADTVGARVHGRGSMLPDTLKKVSSELGLKAARYRGSSTASEQELGDALLQLQSLLKQQVARQSPRVAEAMKALDAGWANLVRVEGAAKLAKGTEGVFTPGQLLSAVQTADKSVRKRAVSRGAALMQDFATSGQNVLGNKVPNSGTTDRLLMGAGALGAGYMLDPLVAAGTLGGAAAYTPWGQALLRGAVSSRPAAAQGVARALEKSAPLLAPALGIYGLEVAK